MTTEQESYSQALQEALNAVQAIDIPHERNVFKMEWNKIRKEWNAAPLIDQSNGHLIEALRDKGAITAPEKVIIQDVTDIDQIPEWIDPGHVHDDMYCKGDIVRLDGKVYESNHNGLNHWRPGDPGIDWRIWRDITYQIETPETVEPTIPEWRPGLDVKIGEQYLYEGILYEVIQAHTTLDGWTPVATPALWASAA